ncbi:MAG: TlpA disulfide reductase family protein [Alphaproteobacteria bacterium]
MRHIGQWIMIAAVGGMLGNPLAAAAATATAPFTLPEPFVPTDPPNTVPNLALRDADDAKTDLAAWRGRYVLLSFWATWCAPCIEEMPSLNTLQNDLGGRKFQVVPVSVEGRARIAKTTWFMRSYRLDELPVLVLENKSDQRAFSVRAVPTTLLIDPEGRELWRVLGPLDWDNSAVRDVLTHYLDGAREK